MLTESTAFVSPISVVHFEYYNSIEDLKPLLQESEEKIQCIVGNSNLDIPGIIPFGQAQKPGLSDYADSVDTMAFLAAL